MPDKNKSYPGNEPGGIRPIRARWVIFAEAFLESPAHFGGKGTDIADMMILRDPRDKRPLLPGTSLAGALRGYLLDILYGFGKDINDWENIEKDAVAELFGGAASDDQGDQSPLIVFDSYAKLDSKSIEIRDGVALDPKTGIAEEHKKFDMEILPAGTTFPLRFELLIEDEKEEMKLLHLLLKSLSSFENGEMYIGVRRSKGLGKLSAKKWKACRFDLSSEQGWLCWLLTDTGKAFPEDVEEYNTLHDALKNAWRNSDLLFNNETYREIDDQRKKIQVELELKSKGSILVRSPGSKTDEPDAVHLTSAGRPLLPGSSLAGALRNRARRIARLVRKEKGDADCWVDALFGPRIEGQIKARAARLRISESFFNGGVPYRPTHVGIDRFTQGAYRNTLFDEEPYFGGRITVSLELRNPKPGEAGFLLLLLKDLLSGNILVGGTSSIGRGVFEGTGKVMMADGKEVDLITKEAIDLKQLEYINSEISKFYNVEKCEQ